jgi:hypothetical protein
LAYLSLSVLQQSLGLLTTPLAYLNLSVLQQSLGLQTPKDCCRTDKFKKFKYAKGVVRSRKDLCRIDKFKYGKELFEALRTVAGQTSLNMPKELLEAL